METLANKNWTQNTPFNKKYLSRMITYKLSSELDNSLYEVVFESPLDKSDGNIVDVVVFDKRRGWCSLMAIEICASDEISDVLIIARGLMEKYSLHDFFVHDSETGKWYNIKKGPMGYSISSDSNFMGIKLEEMNDLVSA